MYRIQETNTQSKRINVKNERKNLSTRYSVLARNNKQDANKIRWENIGQNQEVILETLQINFEELLR